MDRIAAALVAICSCASFAKAVEVGEFYVLKEEIADADGARENLMPGDVITIAEIDDGRVRLDEIDGWFDVPILVPLANGIELLTKAIERDPTRAEPYYWRGSAISRL